MGNIFTKNWHYIAFIAITTLILSISCTDGLGGAGTLPNPPEDIGYIDPSKKSSLPFEVMWDSESEKLYIISNDISFVQIEIQSEGESIYTANLNSELSEQFISLDTSFNGDYILILLDNTSRKNYVPLTIDWL